MAQLLDECRHGLHPATCATCKSGPVRRYRRIAARAVATWASMCACSQPMVPGEPIAKLEQTSTDPDDCWERWMHEECAKEWLS